MITTTTNDILADFKLTASINTITIKTSATIEEIPQEFQAAVKCRSLQKGTQTQASILLNLNKISGDVYCYSRFKELFDMFLNSVGIDEYKITRVDMRFDLFDHGSYEKYAKLNRWLISMLAVKYNVYNTYKTLHLFSQKQLSVAIKNKYFECENYDKTAESRGTDPACDRFEERSKCWTHTDIRKEFEEHWFRRWDEALKMFYQTYQKYNIELERIYIQGKNAYPVQFRSLTDFLIQYQGCIFSNAQMINLLSRFEEVGPDKAVKRADNHKTRYGIEYYDYKTLISAVNEIKRATTEFFDK